MRALNVVVKLVLADEFSQVRLTQRDDAVEAFLFDRADASEDPILSRCNGKGLAPSMPDGDAVGR